MAEAHSSGTARDLHPVPYYRPCAADRNRMQNYKKNANDRQCFSLNMKQKILFSVNLYNGLRWVIEYCDGGGDRVYQPFRSRF